MVRYDNRGNWGRMALEREAEDVSPQDFNIPVQHFLILNQLTCRRGLSLSLDKVTEITWYLELIKMVLFIPGGQLRKLKQILVHSKI